MVCAEDYKMGVPDAETNNTLEDYVKYSSFANFVGTIQISLIPLLFIILPVAPARTV